MMVNKAKEPAGISKLWVMWRSMAEAWRTKNEFWKQAMVTTIPVDQRGSMLIRDLSSST